MKNRAAELLVRANFSLPESQPLDIEFISFVDGMYEFESRWIDEKNTLNEVSFKISSMEIKKTPLCEEVNITVKNNEIPVIFISNWSCDLIETSAKLNLLTGEVFDIDVDHEGTDDLDNDAFLEGQSIYIDCMNSSFTVLTEEVTKKTGDGDEFYDFAVNSYDLEVINDWFEIDAEEE